MSRIDRESLPDVRECPEVVVRPSRMFGSDRESFPDVRESPGVVMRTSRMFGIVREW